MQKLLEDCTSVKVKRVFLYLSEKLNQSYFARLNLSKIDLGKGKRQIVKNNAQFDKKYQITVPKLMTIHEMTKYKLKMSFVTFQKNMKI